MKLFFKNKRKNNVNYDVSNNNESVVFVNKPINSEQEDVIGIMSYVKRIKKAIEKGSNVIGIIGNYGIGKSSVINLLKNHFESQVVKDEKTNKIAKKNKIITINLWENSSIKNSNSTGQIIKENDSNLNSDDMTLDFLFQLSNGCNNNFASYITKKLSKNYGIIGIDTSEINLLKKIRTPIILLVLYWMVSMLPSYIYDSSLYSNLSLIIDFSKYKIISDIIIVLYTFLINLRPVILAVLLWIVIKMFYDKTIVFSWLSSQGAKENSKVDYYSIYLEIAQKLIEKVSEEGKCIIIVEDLDRTDDKNIIALFIKEMFKFVSMLNNEQKKKIVFIIEVKDEAALELKKDEDLYKKVFAFKININGIFYSDYERVLLNILENNEDVKKIFGNKCDKSALIDKFVYCIRGNNLTIRTIKERLNRSCEIYENLLDKDEEKNGKIDFKKCTIVAYLESKYPTFMLDFYKLENEFSKVLSRSYKYKQDSKMSKKECENEIKEVLSSEIKTNALSKEIKDELAEFIYEDLIEDDFRLYFYNYPKGERIKTEDEKYVEKLLCYPNNNELEIDKQRIKNAIALDPKLINNCFKRRNAEMLSFTTVIFQNEDFFKEALNNFYDNVLKVLKNEVLWNAENLEESSNILKRICEYNVDLSRLFQDYLKEIELSFKKLSLTEIVDARLSICLSVSKEYIGCFKNLYFASGMPVIKEKELDSIKDYSQKIKFVNAKLITLNDVEYILNNLNVICDDKSDYDYLISIIKTLKERRIYGKNIKKIIFDFLKKNNRIEEELFEDLVESIIKGEEIIAENEIISYLEKLDAESFSDNILKNIEKLELELSDNILEYLTKKRLFNTYFINMINQNRCNELNLKEDIILNLMIIATIRSKIENNISDLRCEIINQKLEKEYREIFFKPYKIIGPKELDLLKNIESICTYVDFQDIQENELNVVIERINNLLETKEDILEIINVIDKSKINSIKDESLVNYFWKNINIEKIIFSDFTDIELKSIYSVLAKPLMLENFENALDFSERIKFIIRDLDLRFYIMIDNGNRLLTDRYMELINLIDKPTEQTIKNITLVFSKNREYPLSENILKILLEKQYFKEYIIGDILNKDDSIFEKNEKIDIDEYIKEFNKGNGVYEKLKNNNVFKKEIISLHKIDYIEAKYLENFFDLDFNIELMTVIFGKLDKEKIKDYLINYLKITDSSISYKVRMFLNNPKNIWLFEDEKTFNSIKNKMYRGDKAQLTIFKNKYIK